MADEIDRLILKVSGEQEVRKLEEELRKYEKGLADAIAANGKFSASAKSAAADVLKAQSSLKAAEVAARQAGAASGTLAQSISTLSFSLNDAQQFSMGFDQGIRAISNNIPGLIVASQQLASVGIKGITTALVGPTGLILALTAVTSLVPLVSAHWGDLQDWWVGGETSTEAERMDKLAKATSRTADETARLNKYKKEQQTGQALEAGEPEATAKARQAAIKGINELPGGVEAVRDALVAARNPGGLQGRVSEADKAAIRAVDEAQGQLPGVRQRIEAQYGGGPEAVRRKALENARDAERERASGDIAEAASDPARLQGLLNELRRTGNEEYANELEARIYLESEEYRAAETANEEDTRKSAELIGKRKEARKQAAKKEQDEDEKRVENLAENLAEGPLGTKVLAEQVVSVEDVQEQLKRSGVDVSLADAAKIGDELIRQSDAAVESRSTSKGLSPEASREILLQERANRTRTEAEAIQKQQDAEVRKKADEAKKGGADILAKFAAEGGGTPAQIAKLLRGEGIDAESAKLIGGEAFGEERRKKLQEFLGGGDKSKGIEQFGGEDLISRIQAGVGGEGDVQKKQLDKLNRLVQLQEAEARRREFFLGPGATFQ